MSELGNFNYDDPPGTKPMTHYHNVAGSWATQNKNAEHTTEEQIRKQLEYLGGAVMCTTGAGQEYVEPILEKIGFQKVWSFINPGHAKTEVKVWCYLKAG